MKTRMTVALTMTLITLGACTDADETRNGDVMEEMAADQPMPMQGMDSMGAMEGMPGMGGMASGVMMDQMQTHMAMMRAADDDSIAAVMPLHRQMLGNMIAQMNREMAATGMSPDSAWEATIDSLRSDLRTMPGMTPAEVRASMGAHHARVDRLIEMHRGMTPRAPM